MRINAIILLFTALVTPSFAQTTESDYQREVKQSEAICAALFPDSTNPSSELVKTMFILDSRLHSNGSKIYSFSGKPVVLGFEAAGILKINPHWDALTPEDRSIAINFLTCALINTHDFDPSRVVANRSPEPDKPQIQPPTPPQLEPIPIGEAGEILGPSIKASNDAAERKYQYELQLYAIKMGLPPPSFAPITNPPSDAPSADANLIDQDLKNLQSQITIQQQTSRPIGQ